MTLTAAESIKDTWTSIFRRKGRDGAYTRLFDHLDPPQRDILLAEVELRESELAVIASVRDSTNWLVLTTDRLAWSIAGQRQEVPANAIRDAVVDLMQLQRSGHRKLDMHQLQVITMEYGGYLIELEPGSPLIGTWNVLKNLGARNRGRKLAK